MATDADLPKGGRLWEELRDRGPDPSLTKHLTPELRLLVSLMMTPDLDRRPSVKQLLELPSVSVRLAVMRQTQQTSSPSSCRKKLPSSPSPLMINQDSSTMALRANRMMNQDSSPSFKARRATLNQDSSPSFRDRRSMMNQDSSPSSFRVRRSMMNQDSSPSSFRARGKVRRTQDQQTPFSPSALQISLEESLEQMDNTVPSSGSSMTPLYSTPSPSSRRKRPPSSPSPLGSRGKLPRTFRGLSQGRLASF